MVYIKYHLYFWHCLKDRVPNMAAIIHDYHFGKQNIQSLASPSYTFKNFSDLCRRLALTKPLGNQIRWVSTLSIWSEGGLLTQLMILLRSFRTLKIPPFITRDRALFLSTTTAFLADRNVWSSERQTAKIQNSKFYNTYNLWLNMPIPVLVRQYSCDSGCRVLLLNSR